MLIASVLANRFSDRMGVPIVLMFLGVGMLAGSDGIGRIAFTDNALANFIGVFCLSLILFAGGMDTHWKSIRPVLWRAVGLATFGVALTAVFLALFVWWLLPDHGFLHALLLGAIVSSTDAAAVFAIMRSRGVSLKGHIRPLLELESGSNDPMALFLTTAVLFVIKLVGNGDAVSAATWLQFIPKMLANMGIGVACGVSVGYATCHVIRKIRLEYEGLYPVLTLSLVLFTYGLCDTLGGNGFLAVYSCGILLGNLDFPNKRYITRFHDGLSWLSQIVLFLTLGLLVSPFKLIGVAHTALFIAAVLMFVARPLAIYIGLFGSHFTWRDRTLISWTGLRGAVPIVLATFTFTEKYPLASEIFNTVFFIVLASVLVQGKTLMVVARWLKVDKPLKKSVTRPIEFERSAGFKEDMREVEIPADSAIVGQTIANAGLPPKALIVLIERGERFVVPRGQTAIEAYDTLMLLGPEADLAHAQDILLSTEKVTEILV
ncbi:MAG: potassium/proton antiporter [Kiritimatiellaeota bacterium]|nr:potassium/proton antiporter [Kiritimatiellota bacterium]